MRMDDKLMTYNNNGVLGRQSLRTLSEIYQIENLAEQAGHFSVVLKNYKLWLRKIVDAN